MRANTFVSPGKTRVERVPDPKILNDKDAIVRITSTAICGSDLHLYNGFIPTVEPGDIFGHEFMGEVVETGKGVKKVKKGDRVVVAFPIACGSCYQCGRQMYSICENSNPNAWIAQKLMGHSPAGIFGYSHMLGGFAGGQAEYARVPFADVGTIKVPDGMPDEQVLFLSDIFPTGYMGAEMCDIKPGDVIAVWGCGPVGPVRHGQRLPAGRRAGHRDRPLPVPPPHGARAGQGGDDQLRGAGRLPHPHGDDRRPRPRLGDRRRRHGGARRSG